MDRSQIVEYFITMPLGIALSMTFAYFIWFKYDLVEKWADEDKWAGQDFYHTAFAKWFARLISIPFVIASPFLLYLVVVKGVIPLLSR